MSWKGAGRRNNLKGDRKDFFDSASLKITLDHYQAGTIGVSDLLEAQAIFQSTCDNLTEARCTYQVKLAEYKKVTGNRQ